MVADKLVNDWLDAGVASGDTLLLHSSLKRTFLRYKSEDIRLTPQMLLKSFIDALGPTGTLVLPLFNFSFTQGVEFNIKSTPSQMGALTEAGRQWPNAVRTRHPIYSFAVIGKYATEFGQLRNKSAYGPDSPFALLRKLDGKIGVLNLSDQNSMTFYHHVEEENDVPYRYHKEFTAPYIDIEGNRSDATYSIFVRDLEKGILTHVDPAGEKLWAANIFKGDKPNEGAGLRTASAREVFDFVSDLINRDQALNNLYKIQT